jgi:hypothetical protein
MVLKEVGERCQLCICLIALDDPALEGIWQSFASPNFVC